MKKIISLTILFVFILITLTGCVKVNYEVTINKDGSGEVAYVYGIEKSFLEELSAEEMTADMREMAEDSDYEVEPYSDKDIEGFKATKKVQDITEAFSLEEVFGEENVQDSKENKINIKKGLFSTKYSQKAAIDLTEMGETAGFVTIRYSVNLPTKAGKNNANVVSKDGKTLTWVLAAGKVTDVEFEANGRSVVGNIVLLLVALVLMGVVATVVLKLVKKNKDGKATVDAGDKEAEEPKIE